MQYDAATIGKWWRQLFADDDVVTPEERRAASRGLDRALDHAKREVLLAMVEETWGEESEMARALVRADAILEELVDEGVGTQCTEEDTVTLAMPAGEAARQARAYLS